MKKCIWLSAFFLFAKISAAQYSLAFCENVTAEGSPQKVSSSFTVGNNGGAVKILLRSDEEFNTDQLKFAVYYINTEGNEEEVAKLPQKVEPAWNFTWKEIELFNAGTYRVKVYNGKGTYLTSANLNVKRGETDK